MEMLSDRNVINDRMGAEARSTKKIETKGISATIPRGLLLLTLRKNAKQRGITYFLNNIMYLLLKK